MRLFEQECKLGVSTRMFTKALCTVAALSLLAACQSPADKEGFDALNADRVEYGVPPVTYNNMLQNKADSVADQLAKTGVLEHSHLPDGITGCWRGLAENIGYGPSVQVIEDAYMNSPKHKTNIVNERYDYGAVAVVDTGKRVYTVQEFLDKC